MELTETTLIDLYTWCFTVAPDTVLANSAASSDGTSVLEINQVTDSYERLIWDVKARDANYVISSFEVDLVACIENFKSAWSVRENPI